MKRGVSCRNVVRDGENHEESEIERDENVGLEEREEETVSSVLGRIVVIFERSRENLG